MTRRFIRPLAYLTFILAWLIVMSLPVVAFLLATRGEIQLGSNARSGVRVFLVQESEAQGIGVEWSRRHGDAVECARTTLRYFFWEGGEPGQGVEYCRCYDTGSGLAQESVACDEL